MQVGDRVQLRVNTNMKGTITSIAGADIIVKWDTIGPYKHTADQLEPAV